MKLIAVRHGEALWNVEGREMGQLDSPLTPRGVAQAQALAQRLAQVKFDVLYSSDLGRAVQTAQIISAACGKPIIIEARLRERHMGIFQGLTACEILEQHPVEKRDYANGGAEYQIPGGESAAQRLKRSIRVLTDLATTHEGATVVAVTHGGFLMGFFEHVLGLHPGEGWRFMRSNGSFNAFEYSQGRWVLETWNDVGHLQDLPTLDDPSAQS